MEKQEFKYLDFSKEAEAYLKELEPPKKVIVVSSTSSNTLSKDKPLTTKFKKFTLDDLQIIDALRVLKKQFFPLIKDKKQIKRCVGLKAQWGGLEDIDSNKVRVNIRKFQSRFRFEQDKLLDEAFGA